MLGLDSLVYFHNLLAYCEHQYYKNAHDTFNGIFNGIHNH